MSINRFVVAWLALTLLTGVSTAQQEIAFGSWVGITANSAGFGTCQSQNCQTAQLDLNTVQPGNLTITVYGEAGQPFLLAAAPTANSCIAIPGVANSLMLDPPFFILTSGIMPVMPAGITICGSLGPPGRWQLTSFIPAGFCFSGFDFYIQALVMDAGSFSFTGAIHIFC